MVVQPESSQCVPVVVCDHSVGETPPPRKKEVFANSVEATLLFSCFPCSVAATSPMLGSLAIH